jgi:uncharacterized protein YndB with AHSA1/START domain
MRTGSMQKTNLMQQITVHALRSKIWKVLTNPDYVNQYFLQKNITCNWTEGSSILAMSDDESTVKNVGQVLESVPGILLKFNLLEQHSFTYITTTYELIVDNDGVELKLKWEGFTASGQEYFLREQQAKLLLQKIKWLSEYS